MYNFQRRTCYSAYTKIKCTIIILNAQNDKRQSFLSVISLKLLSSGKYIIIFENTLRHKCKQYFGGDEIQSNFPMNTRYRVCTVYTGRILILEIQQLTSLFGSSLGFLYQKLVI